MTTKITEQNISNLANAGIDWQAVKTSNFTASAGEGYFVNTASGAVTVTLPSSPTIGDTISVVDYGGVSASSNKQIILAGNGSKILASSVNKTISTNEVGVVLVFTDSTKGWVINGAYVQTGLVGVPGAPTIGTAALDGSDVDVPFTAPSDNGDATITTYTATASPGGASATLSQAGSGTITVTGLAVNTAFTFTVTATNSVGVSAASAASNSVTTPNVAFTAATGGTVTTSGDYKIHTFTGDGNFVVGTLGTGGAGGPSTVSYLVVAGGGAGGAKGAGGGGAGGFREGRDITPSYTASPLVAGSGLTIAAQTYPITVGAGGGGVACNCGSNIKIPGSNSVFSTITSTAGGGGGVGGGGSPKGNNPQNNSQAGDYGGSGGGAFDQRTNPAFRGVGNEPPVSPAQGTPGGNGVDFPPSGGGGGGGAGGQGANASSPGGPSPANKGGNGGAGVTTQITGAPLLFSSGGGGGIRPGAQGGGDGGDRGNARQGGSGAPHPSPDTSGGTGQSGVANTGGGGGGAAGPTQACRAGGSGGKGVVVIRYKFQ